MIACGAERPTLVRGVPVGEIRDVTELERPPAPERPSRS
jgi:hypothetical protein